MLLLLLYYLLLFLSKNDKSHKRMSPLACEAAKAKVVSAVPSSKGECRHIVAVYAVVAVAAVCCFCCCWFLGGGCWVVGGEWWWVVAGGWWVVGGTQFDQDAHPRWFTPQHTQS